MDNQQRKLLADFLKKHRAQLSPSDVGLPISSRRRTPGLRREEVAQLADIGTTWYTWLEQGRDINVSEKVLWRIADALKFTPDERKHMFMLVYQQFKTLFTSSSTIVSPILQQILDNQGSNPAYLTGQRCDLLAWNQSAAAVFGDFSTFEAEERNLIWLLFTNNEFRQLFVNWERVAQNLLAIFRACSVQCISDPWYIHFVKVLQQVSPEFERWWQRHEVCNEFKQHRELIHPICGHLSLDVTTLHVNGDQNLRLCIYTAFPGSETATKLQQITRESCQSSEKSLVDKQLGETVRID